MKLSPTIREGVRLAIFLTIWLRVILFVTGYNLLQKISPLPVTTKQMDLAVNIPKNSSDSWFSLTQPLHRFDALWYEEIAKTDYHNRPLAAAFFPLFPWFVRVISYLFHLSFPTAAFICTTFFTALTFFLFYYYGCLSYTSSRVRTALFFFACFPTSFFLLTPYAESLLFSLTLVSLILIKLNKPILAVVPASLAAMTKPYAVFLIIPLFFKIITSKSFSERIKVLFVCLSMIFSFVFVLMVEDSATGLSTTFMTARATWGVRFGDTSWFESPWFALKRIISSPWDLPNTLNVTTVLLSCYMIVKSRSKVPSFDWVYTLTFFFVFFFMTYNLRFYGFSRNILLLFPLFYFFSSLRVNSLFKKICLVTSSILQVLLFLLFTLGFFVA